MLTTAQKLESLTALGKQLNQVADLDILMERTLTEARRFANADAGSIYIVSDSRLLFSYTQNTTIEKRLPAGDKLIYSTFSVPIDENSIAGCAAKQGRTINIPDVYRLEDDKPYHFSRQFDDAANYRTRSMLTIPLKTSRDAVIGVLQIINAQNESGEITPFSNENENMMHHFASIAAVALERACMTRAMILRTIKMAEMRDPKETGAHVNRVASYSVEIFEHWAHKNRIDPDEIETKRDVFRMAAMLHDVGKVGISDAILKKPGRFTPEEFEIMKGHTLMGAQLFGEKQSEFDDAAADVALSHHERWDGKGYPDNRTADEIPLLGRIVAIADVYDALCSKRVYKPAWQESEALDVLRQEAGKQFDPDLVESFFARLDVIRSLRERYPDENETGSEQTIPPAVNI